MWRGGARCGPEWRSEHPFGVRCVGESSGGVASVADATCAPPPATSGHAFGVKRRAGVKREARNSGVEGGAGAETDPPELALRGSLVGCGEGKSHERDA